MTPQEFLDDLARDTQLKPAFRDALMAFMKDGDLSGLRRYYQTGPLGTCADCGDRKPVHRWGLSERDDLICTACDTIRRDDLRDHYQVAEKHCWKCGQTPSEAEHAWRMHGMLCNHCSPSMGRAFDDSGAADYERGVGR